MLEQKTNRYYKNRYKFTGKELDERTGLYDFGARHYNPSWSVWLSVDPMAHKMPKWSPYNYTFGNPLRFTDPTGMELVDPPKKTYNGGTLKEATVTAQRRTPIQRRGAVEMGGGSLGQPSLGVMVSKNQDVGKKATDISQSGLNFIASYEGFSPTVYKVGGRGNPTIGFGHELLPGESFPNEITREQGLQLLRQDVQVAVNAINKYVTEPLNQYQFDALTSYVFNAGPGNTLIRTKLISNLNSGNYRGAALQMDIVKSGGIVLRGLQLRRKAEQNLFLNGKYK